MASLALLILLAGCDAAAESIAFNPHDRAIDQGSETTFDIVLDSAPRGLAGYEISVSIDSPGAAEITSASFPSWARVNSKSGLPADTVTLSGVDVNRQVQNGSANIILATITVRGEHSGSTGLSIDVREVDADGGDAINASGGNSQLTVMEKPSPTPAATATVTPVASPTVTPAATATATTTPSPAVSPTATLTATPTPAVAANPSSGASSSTGTSATSTATASATAQATATPSVSATTMIVATTVTPTPAAATTVQPSASASAVAKTSPGGSIWYLLIVIGLVIAVGFATYYLFFKKK